MNYTKCILSLLILLFSHITYAQTFSWATHGGGLTSDKGTAIVTDVNGYSYVTGYFNEEADFGPFHMPLIDLQSKEVFIAKIDPLGNYVWVKRGSNHYDDRGLGICLDPTGNIYVTGTCWGGIIFGGLTNYNSTSYTDQIFVLKLDNNGNFIWLENAGNDYGDDHGQDIICDKLGNVYITGFVSNWNFGSCSGSSVAQFGSQTIPLNCDSLGFVAKLSSSGVWQWAKSFGGVDGERDNHIAIDTASNVYVSGGFTKTKTFGTSVITSKGGVDIFITKYDKNGNFQFVKNTGSSLDDRANDLTVADNNIYITGEFRDKVVFNTDTINNNGGPNGRDIFVAKMSSNGNWHWAKKAGSSSGSDRGNGIISNKKSNIFVTGQFKGNANFGSTITLTTTATDSVQAFVAAIDTSGKWRWAIQGGGMDEERGNSISCDTSCNAYITGYYSLGVAFGNHSLTNYGKKDIFITGISNACFEYTVTPITNDPIVQECQITIPNVFTPNNDKINDIVYVQGNCITELQFDIFNRWGTKIYSSNNIAEGWNGKHNDSDAPDGTYFYFVEATLQNNEHIKEKGFLNLFR